VILDKKTYKLDGNKYYDAVSDKHQIVVGHTGVVNMNHINTWNNRLNGSYKKTAPFTIALDGTVYEHYDPKFYSDFTSEKNLNRFIIPIVLENEGWLIKDIKNNRYLNWLGNIYNREDSVVTKKWRGKEYWAPYSDAQFDSLLELLDYLCGKFKITKETIGYNTKVDNIIGYNGISVKSNYSTEFTDLSPAWDFVKFKNNLEGINIKK
jgi:hypothetical protein